MSEGKYEIKLSTMEKIVIISVSISVIIGLSIMGKYGYLLLHIFPILSENQYPAFYTAIVTSLAAILSIVFAISLIAIQHAADKYTPSILNRYKKDIKFNGIYLIFSSSIVFGVIALWFRWNHKGALLAFILLVIGLICLYVQLRSMVNFVDPRKLIEKLKEETLKIKKPQKETLDVRENDRIKRNCLDLKQIATKSIERHEDKVCIECIKALKEIVIKTLLEESQRYEERLVRYLSELNWEILLMLREIGVTAAKERRSFATRNVISDIGSVASECGKMEHILIIALDDLIDTIYIIGEEVTANKPDRNDLDAVVISLHSLCREFVSDEHLKVKTEKIILYLYRFSIKAAEHQYYWIISNTLQFYADESLRQRIKDAEIISLIIRDSICMCAVGIKNLSQEHDRQQLRVDCFSALKYFLENKDYHEYFDKAKEYCSDYKKGIGELKEQFEKFLKKSKGEKDG